MVKYSCTRCLKEFSQKSHYNQHQKRKTPCQDNSNKLAKVIETIVEEKLNSKLSKLPKKPRIKLNKKITIKKQNNIDIINGDCMEELAKMDNNSIDCVITDPPYFIDKLDNNWSSKQIKEDKKNSHIKHLPKGMKFDKKQVKKLYDYYLEFARLLYDKNETWRLPLVLLISKIISCNSHGM